MKEPSGAEWSRAEPSGAERDPKAEVPHALRLLLLLADRAARLDVQVQVVGRPVEVPNGVGSVDKRLEVCAQAVRDGAVFLLALRPSSKPFSEIFRVACLGELAGWR